MDRNSLKPSKRLYRSIVGTALALAFLLAALLFRWGGSGPIVAFLPWFIPMISLFHALILFCVAFLAIGRYNVLRNPAAFWIAMGAAGFGVALAFYILSWPGLLPDGGSLIANLPGTPAWFMQIGMTHLGAFLLPRSGSVGRAMRS